MAGQFSGVKKVEYSIAGANVFVDLLEVHEDSEGPKPEVATVPTGSGHNVYAGKRDTLSFKVFDLSKFAALETAMKNDQKIDMKVTLIDDTVLPVYSNLSVVVQMEYGMKVAGRNVFSLTATGFTS